MTRDDLEATFRRTITGIAIAYVNGTADTRAINTAVGAILTAADGYATGDSDGVTAMRRDVLHEAAAPKPGGGKYDDHRARLGEPGNLHLNPRSKDGH